MQTISLNSVFPLAPPYQMILFLITLQGFAWMSACLVLSETMILSTVFKNAGGLTLQILPLELAYSSVLEATLATTSQLHVTQLVQPTLTLILSRTDAWRSVQPYIATSTMLETGHVSKHVLPISMQTRINKLAFQSATLIMECMPIQSLICAFRNALFPTEDLHLISHVY